MLYSFLNGMWEVFYCLFFQILPLKEKPSKGKRKKQHKLSYAVDYGWEKE